jgi:hypothetical protein
MLGPLVARVRGILLRPRDELLTTIAEPGTPRALARAYVLPMAAIAPVAELVTVGGIGVYHAPFTVFNSLIPGAYTRAPVAALGRAVLLYALAVGAWPLLAWAFIVLAPSFGGQRDRAGASKAAAYTLTPVWLSGALFLSLSIPYLDWLATLGPFAGVLYAIVIGRAAVPLHLGTPEPRAPGHVLAALAVTVVATLGAWAALTAI